jgi:hypothetical protein
VLLGYPVNNQSFGRSAMIPKDQILKGREWKMKDSILAIEKAWQQNSVLSEYAVKLRLQPFFLTILAGAKSAREIETLNHSLEDNKRLPVRLVKELKRFWLSHKDINRWAVWKTAHSAYGFGYEPCIDLVYLREVRLGLNPYFGSNLHQGGWAPPDYGEVWLKPATCVICRVSIGAEKFIGRCYFNEAESKVIIGLSIRARELTEPRSHYLREFFSGKIIGFADEQYIYIRGHEAIEVFLQVEIEHSGCSIKETREQLGIECGSNISKVYFTTNDSRANLVLLIEQKIKEIFGQEVLIS